MHVNVAANANRYVAKMQREIFSRFAKKRKVDEEKRGFKERPREKYVHSHAVQHDTCVTYESR